MGVGRIGDGAACQILGDRRHGSSDGGGKSCWIGIAPLLHKMRGQAARCTCPGTYIPSQIACIPFHSVSFRFISFHSVSLRCNSIQLRAHSDAVLRRPAAGRGKAAGRLWTPPPDRLEHSGSRVARPSHFSPRPEGQRHGARFTSGFKRGRMRTLAPTGRDGRRLRWQQPVVTGYSSNK